MKLRKFFSMMAVLVSVSMLFTACPNPEPGPKPPGGGEGEGGGENPPVSASYDEVKLVGNCKKSDMSASSWTFYDPVSLGAASKLSAAKLAEGGKKIIGVRARLDYEVTDFKVFLGEDYQNPEIVKEAEYVEGGWQYVLFDKPYEVADKDLYIGWEGNTKSLVLEELRTAVAGEMAKMENQWVDVATFCKEIELNDGNAYITKVAWPVQAICVEGDYSAETRLIDAAIDGISVASYSVVGESQRIAVEVRNAGINTAKGIEVSATVGSDKQSVKMTKDLMNGQSAIVYVDVMQGAVTSKTQTVNVEISLAGDQAVRDNVNKFDGQRVYQNRSMSRNAILIEQFTGQGCGYCPGGAAAIKEAMAGLDAANSDKVAWIANHTYGTDAFTVSESAIIASRLGVASAPMCNINRMVINYQPGKSSLIWSPYAVTTDMLTALIGEPALADLKLEPSYDAGSRTFTVKVTGKTSEAEAYLTAVVSQNGIKAQQADYSIKAGQQSDYEHNHAPRKFLSPAIGDKLELGADGTFTKEYTYTIPEKVGSFACVPEDMEFVAFVHGNIASASNRVVFNTDWVKVTTGNREAPDYTQMPEMAGLRLVSAGIQE